MDRAATPVAGTGVQRMLQGRTLWELLERRVDATPDALMAVDEDMRTVTFAEYWAEAERAAAGLAAQGVGRGDVVAWQLPTWIESLVLVGALEPDRGGAEPDAARSTASERWASSPTRPGRRCMIVPSVWKGFDFEAMATSHRRRRRLPMRVLVADRALPQGDPSALPPIEEPLDAGDQPVRWLFYTSGTTADPKGAQHTDASIAAVATGMAERMGVIEADRNALVFPFTHIGGITWLFTSLQTGCSNILMEGFHPAADARGAVAGERHPRRFRHRVPPGLPGLPAQPAHAGVPPRAGLPRGRCAEATVAGGRDAGGLRRPGAVGLRPHRGPDPDHGRPVRRRRGAGRQRGQAHARRGAALRDPRRRDRRAGRGGRDPGQGAPGHARLPRLLAWTRTPSTRTGSSAPATSAGSTTGAT